jgi:molybdate transport system substrate-binding protein
VIRALLTLLLAACLAAPLRADPVLIFAASSLREGLDRALAAAPAEVVVSYASTAALARQIDQGAPADLFIAASPDWMDWLEGRGALRPGTRADLLTNGLVLVEHGPGPAREEAVTPQTDIAGRLGEGYLAMALVEAVPAGIYGKAALRSLGLWPGLEGRIVQTDNVRAALALVARGEAPLGIVYRTDALAEPGVHVVGVFRAADHPPIVYPAALLDGSDNPHAAAVLGHLRGPEARAAFIAAGFGMAD